MKKIVFILLILSIFILTGCKKETKVLVYDGDGNVIQELSNEDDVIKDLPQKEGYTFMGFNRSVDEKTGNILLTPDYRINTFNVVFFNGDDTALFSTNVDYGTKVTAPVDTPTKEGHDFVGWDFDFDTVIMENKKIYPIFTKKEFTVKFYLDDVLLKEQKVLYGECAEAPNVDDVDHFKFEMWDTTFCFVESDLIVTAIGYKYLNYGFYDKYHNFISSMKVPTSACEAITYPDAPVVPYHTFIDWEEEDNENSEYDKVLVATYSKDSTVLDKNNSAYWIRENAEKLDVTKVIFTLDEINKINDNNIFGAYDKTKVVDVRKIDNTITGTKLKSLINDYSNISKYTVYNEDGSVHSDTSDILNNRNINTINDTVNVKFGIITDFARLRSYPTNCYSKGNAQDMFQETSLNVGEGVAIYHYSTDNNWCFVQANNYYGWIEVKNVGLCTKDQMLKFLNASEKIVVISNFVTINNHHVRMGQAFPYLETVNDKYSFSFPTRTSNGTLELISVTASSNDDYNLGYLPYTYENILIQAFKILEMSYSWGDKYETGRDCSSTQNGILATFGFIMPRNTSNQRSIPLYSDVLSGLTGYRLKTDYLPGTLIFSSGHVMLYIGMDADQNPYILHNTTGGGANKCILQNYYEYTNTIIAALSFKK